MKNKEKIIQILKLVDSLTLDEIAEEFNLKDRSTIHYYIKRYSRDKIEEEVKDLRDILEQVYYIKDPMYRMAKGLSEDLPDSIVQVVEKVQQDYYHKEEVVEDIQQEDPYIDFDWSKWCIVNSEETDYADTLFEISFVKSKKGRYRELTKEDISKIVDRGIVVDNNVRL